ncbi:protein of unknown function [Burkholderia multivorans]
MPLRVMRRLPPRRQSGDALPRARSGFTVIAFSRFAGYIFKILAHPTGDRPDTAQACDSVTIRARWKAA